MATNVLDFYACIIVVCFLNTFIKTANKCRNEHHLMQADLKAITHKMFSEYFEMTMKMARILWNSVSTLKS